MLLFIFSDHLRTYYIKYPLVCCHVTFCPLISPPKHLCNRAYIIVYESSSDGQIINILSGCLCTLFKFILHTHLYTHLSEQIFTQFCTDLNIFLKKDS